MPMEGEMPGDHMWRGEIAGGGKHSQVKGQNSFVNASFHLRTCRNVLIFFIDTHGLDCFRTH
jgi:hypothetical protein